MSIGIIIPAYNAERFLAETLDSVMAQTEPDFEAIVVDDGSTDGTAALAQSYAGRDPRMRVIRQPNAGTAQARNAGAAALSPNVSVVAFLDHDDVWTTDALATLRAALEANPNAVAVHGMARKVDAAGKPIGVGSTSIAHYERRAMVAGKVVTAGRVEPTRASMVIYDNQICTPGLALIRCTALESLTPLSLEGRGAGGERSNTLYLKEREAGREVACAPFDPEYAPLDDWDFWLRLTRLGDIAFVDRVVLEWRRHEAAGSTDVSAMSAAELRIRERLIAADLPSDLRRIAEDRYRKLLATRQRRAARDLWKAALAHFGAGRAAEGANAWVDGTRAYLRYLGLPLSGRV